MSTSKIIALVVVCFLIVLIGLIYIDWRRDERENPETRFRGPAPIRFLKHIGVKIFDAVWFNFEL